MMGKLKDLLAGIRDIIYPPLCLACGQKLSAEAAEAFVCPGCWAGIKKNTPPFCRRCGRELKEHAARTSICPACVKRPPAFDRAFSPCSYEGVLKKLILDFKYRDKEYLGTLLSRLILEHIREYELPLELIDAVIPIPLHKTRLREREFNQAQILSFHIAEEFGLEMIPGNLIRKKHTRPQAELSQEERLKNVKESFFVKEPEALRGKNVLLIDDILTTGATSSEAALALKNAGVNVVFVLSLAN